MKRIKLVQMLLTEDEHSKLLEALVDAENKAGKRLTVSTFLRHTVFASINGSTPPAIPDNEQTTVSKPPDDTFSSLDNIDTE